MHRQHKYRPLEVRPCQWSPLLREVEGGKRSDQENHDMLHRSCLEKRDVGTVLDDARNVRAEIKHLQKSYGAN